MTFNPAFVILMTLIIVGGVIFYVERSQRKKKIEEIEGVMLFGEKVTTQDYISFCNTCIAYLLIDGNNELNLANFIHEDKLNTDETKESMKMIEKTINAFPIISCTWIKDVTLVVNEEETITKTEAYQSNTHGDDYVVPLFDMGLISRNPNIFNVSTRYQQAKTVQNILNTRGVGEQFEEVGAIEKGLEQIADGKKDYQPADVLYSQRNIQI